MRHGTTPTRHHRGSTRSPEGRARPARWRRLSVVVVAVAVAATGCIYAPWDDVNPQAVDARTRINDLLDQADAAEGGGDLAGAQVLRDQAAAEECATFGCEAPAGTTTVGMDPLHASGFFSGPWPSDTRLRANGALDLVGFPGRSTVPVADIVVGQGELTTFGFGTNSAVYFQASAAVDPATLPLAELSTHRRSSAMLLDLDHPGAPPTPVLTDTKAGSTPLRPANLVTLLPYPGHPLRSATRYAAVLFDSLRDVSGNRLVPSPIIDQLDGAAPPGVSAATWTTLQQGRTDTIAAVRDQTLWHPSEVVAFTTFTTQDTTGNMEALADAVAALPPPQVLSRTPDTGACPPGGQSHTTGRLALPNWQQGTRPYVLGGGGLVKGPGGALVQQGVQMGADGQGVLLDMAVPCGPAPPNGWPILLWVNGTGGSARATPISQLGPTPPYAVLSIAPLYSGDRLVTAAPPFDTSEFQFFNYGNPLAARTNLMQQAADVLYLKRIAQGLTLAPGEAGGGVDHFDASTVVMAGHSQGSSSLPLTLAVDPTVRGAFLSAGGAGLYHSIVHRGDVRVLVDGLLGSQAGELDIFHPYPQILQTFAEEGDAANYGAAITTDVALYAGLRDGCSAIEVSVHLAEAMDVPILGALPRQPFFAPDAVAAVPDLTSPLEPAVASAPPISANLPGGRTGVMVVVDSGHFGASTYPAIGRSFIDAIAAGGPTAVTPGATPPAPPGAQCPRFDPVPTDP